MKNIPYEYAKDGSVRPSNPVSEDLGGQRWKPGRPAGWQPGRVPDKHPQSKQGSSPEPFLGVPVQPQEVIFTDRGSSQQTAEPSAAETGDSEILPRGGAPVTSQAHMPHPGRQKEKIVPRGGAPVTSSQSEKNHGDDMSQKKNSPQSCGDNPQPDTNQDEKSKETDVGEQTAEILETGGLTAKKGKHVLHCLTIIGQIEGHYILPAQNKTTKYEHVIPQLLAVEQDPEIEGLVVILNTVGGDVEAGLAIAELLSGMKKPTVSLVLGGGHSIGVPLAVSCRKSFIAPSATMTVHPVRMNGLVLGIPQTLSYFDRMQERIANFVTENSRIGKDRFRALMMNKDELVMDVGSVLDGQSAVDEGLIDSLGGIADVIESLYSMIEEGQQGENVS